MMQMSYDITITTQDSQVDSNFAMKNSMNLYMLYTVCIAVDFIPLRQFALISLFKVVSEMDEWTNIYGDTLTILGYDDGDQR